MESILASFSELNENGELVVDMTNPNFNAEAIDYYAVRNPNVRINVIESGPEVEMMDAEEQRQIQQNKTEFEQGRVCDGLPRPLRGPRTVSNGACNPETGQTFYGLPHSGPVSVSVKNALNETLRLIGGNETSISANVDVNKGHAVIDLNGDLIQFAVAANVSTSALSSALIETVYSDSRIDSFQFSLNGSCIDYAISLGGDTCVNLTADSIPVG